MDNVPQGPTGTATHSVELTCALGTIHWSVNPDLYGRMPRKTRDEFLNIVGQQRITPDWNDLTVRLLRQAGVACNDPSALDTSWCFETKDGACTCYGSLTWLIGQGVHDAIPEDQRPALLELAVQLMHGYLRDFILPKLDHYAMRSFQQ